MALVMLHFIGAFVLGASVIAGLNKNVLTKEPLEVFNSVLVCLFFLQLSCVSFLRQLPVTNIQSLDFFCPSKKKQDHQSGFYFVRSFQGLI